MYVGYFDNKIHILDHINTENWLMEQDEIPDLLKWRSLSHVCGAQVCVKLLAHFLLHPVFWVNATGHGTSVKVALGLSTPFIHPKRHLQRMWSMFGAMLFLLKQIRTCLECVHPILLCRKTTSNQTGILTLSRQALRSTQQIFSVTYPIRRLNM